VHPFLNTLQKWGALLGISTFVFIQWVAPFLSEFPEYLSAFNWARQRNKAPMALMNLASSNINQWTMLAAMIPLVFNFSLGRWEPIVFDSLHRTELSLTIAQSVLGGMLLLDHRFSLGEAVVILVLWLVQFVFSPFRPAITLVYVSWCVLKLAEMLYHYFAHRKIPRSLVLMRSFLKGADT
jgi:cation:H+ antiporter